MDLKQLVKRKLKEFPRWCRVAVLHQDMIQVDENRTIKLFEFDPEDYKGRIHAWQREAPNEANEILKAINAVAKPRHRAVLIMSYILPEKIQSAEQAQRLAIKSSTYYLAKNKALEEFASQYRSGILERYRGGQPYLPY
ncbi:phage encoded ArpU family transcriptional regulator [Streptococcus suis]|nr:phage encoded ArpU family transcriptional regulator [Streptococcus suis]